MQLCRQCNKYKPLLNPEGFCKGCMRKVVMKRKLDNFNRRSGNLNRVMSGGIT